METIKEDAEEEGENSILERPAPPFLSQTTDKETLKERSNNNFAQAPSPNQVFSTVG